MEPPSSKSEVGTALNRGVLLLAYMSHEGANDGYGILTKEGERLYRVFATKAREWGAGGVIVSAKSDGAIKEVRSIISRDCLIFSPGVGPQGGTALSARTSGADFIIVGRSVTEASDPSRAVVTLRDGLWFGHDADP